MNRPSHPPRVSRSFKLYPELPMARLGYVLADLAALLWVILWLYVGDAVYTSLIALQAIGNGLIKNGRAVDNAVSQLQSAVNNLPLIGSNLRDAFGPLHGPPHALIQTGQGELLYVSHLATLLGVVVAAVPILIALLFFIPWRVRRTRDFHNLAYMLHRPGAGSVTTTMQVLAARAIYTLPYDQLLAYSPDPIGEWREGRYYNLARAAMAAEGLDVRRYLRRVEGMGGLPPSADEPHNLPTTGDESSREDLH